MKWLFFFILPEAFSPRGEGRWVLTHLLYFLFFCWYLWISFTQKAGLLGADSQLTAHDFFKAECTIVSCWFLCCAVELLNSKKASDSIDVQHPPKEEVFKSVVVLRKGNFTELKDILPAHPLAVNSLPHLQNWTITFSESYWQSSANRSFSL